MMMASSSGSSGGGFVEPRGERIEEYDCAELLGKGAFASVYRARCRITGSFVAIKMIDKHLMKVNRMTDRVKQEATIHRRLSHPAVLQLFRFFEDTNYIYLVLELAEHGDIQNYLSANNIQLNEDETAIIMQQIVDGLKYLHSHNILHRDMKLPNLLVTANMRVKIADFGLATQLSRPDEKHMTMCGTPNYISPEVAMRTAHGQPADVWGLGIMMYTLLVGRPPFDTDGVASTLKKVVSSELMIPINMSAEARDLLDKLLQKDPNSRIRLDDVLRHPFMRKYLPPVDGVAHHDSGVMTMSTNPSSISSATALSRTRSDPYPQSRYHLPIVEEMAEQYDLLPVQPVESGYADQHYGSSMNLNAFAAQGLQRFGSEAVLSKPAERFGGSRQASVYQQQQAMEVESKGHVFGQQLVNQFPAPVKIAPPPPMRIEVDQLNAERLLPTRYKTKKAILSIDGAGQVVVEVLRFKSKLRQDRVIDVCRISKDGSRIEIYQPDPGRGLEVHESPPPFDAQEVYTFSQLPAKHWKKYTYAARFVQLVRAKTPKITYYSARAKCQLMETLDDFEMFFYESNEKFTKSLADGIRYYDACGRCVEDAESHAGRPGPGPPLTVWEHFKHCLNHCLAVEKTLRSMQSPDGGEVFPNTAGRRPVTMPQIVGSRAMVEQCANILTPRTPNMQSFAMSVSSTASSRMPTPSTQSKTTPFTMSSGRVLVPGIGIATKSAQGVLEIQYNDDTQLTVLPKEQGGGFIFRKSVSDGGIPMRYTINDELPELVRVRLEQIPMVLKHMAAQDGGFASSTPVSAHTNPLGPSSGGGQMTATSTPLTTRRPSVMRFCR